MSKRKTGAAGDAPVAFEQPRQGGSYVRDRATGKLVRKEWTGPADDKPEPDPLPIGGDAADDQPPAGTDAGEPAAN